MINAGIISNVATGMYAFLPLGLRSLQKLINLIDQEMTAIGAQKILLPVLTQTNLWQQTARLKQAQSELFMLNDRHGKEFLLSPTYEESISNMISQVGPLQRKQLPLRLYQTSSKWRDEIKPRLGLLRSREFIMKDLYTFDLDADSAKCTYEEVSDAYKKIFERIGIPYKKVIADTGIIGGSISHEYHYVSDIGEDVILSCKSCKYEVDKVDEPKTRCPKCEEPLISTNSIEVGHTFLLGTKYSKPLKATFVDSNCKKQFLEMGCYGLGLTRILATAIEILSTNLEIRWPLELAPHSICVIPPKKGSKEEAKAQLAYDVYSTIQNCNLDVIFDDRVDMTIGKRFIDARKTGYPVVIIIGKSCLADKPLVEVHNVYKASHVNLALENVVEHVKGLLKK
ncbi:probable proline--tRNA ligase, mitochondrial isoform X2 [Nasonia vitripennis]|nr:probable proline--tRNA ligase, mitochondrial isoform X2 [Nasonia vitripennis]